MVLSPDISKILLVAWLIYSSTLDFINTENKDAPLAYSSEMNHLLHSSLAFKSGLNPSIDEYHISMHYFSFGCRSLYIQDLALMHFLLPVCVSGFKKIWKTKKIECSLSWFPKTPCIITDSLKGRNTACQAKKRRSDFPCMQKVTHRTLYWNLMRDFLSPILYFASISWMG